MPPPVPGCQASVPLSCKQLNTVQCACLALARTCGKSETPTTLFSTLQAGIAFFGSAGAGHGSSHPASASAMAHHALEPSPLGGTRLLVVVGAGVAEPVGAVS